MEVSIYTLLHAPLFFSPLFSENDPRLKQPSEMDGFNTVILSQKDRTTSNSIPAGSSNKNLGTLVKTVQFPDALNKPLQPWLTPEITKAGQIMFDEFSLLNKHGLPRKPKKHEIRIMMDLFPTTYAIEYMPPFLIIRVRQFTQESSWPFAIAGMPLFLTTDENTLGYNHGHLGSAKPIREDIDVTQHKLSDVFTEIISFFEDSLKVRIQEVCYMISFWKITLLKACDMSKVPMKFAKLPCKIYLAGSEQYIETARQLEGPDGNSIAVDDSTYINSLRPGVMVSSKGSFPQDNLFTTSGIALRESANGKKFMTVASHGFPLGQKNVYHADRHGRVIGTIVERYDGTDISLVELPQDLSYSKIPFGALGLDAAPISIFAHFDDFIPHSLVRLDSPYTGLRYGLALGVSWKRMDDKELTPPWAHQFYMWMGNNLEPKFAAGRGGSAILNESNEVIGFFRSAIEGGNGVAAGVCGDFLSDRFEIVSI